VIRAEYEHYLSPYEKLQWNIGRRAIEAAAAKKRMWRALQDHDIKVARKEAFTTMSEQPWAIDSWKSLFFALRGH
jgi:hypothetical protein